MTVIGIKKTSFKGDGGETIEGMNIYCTYPLDPKKGGDGDAAERLFLTKFRLNECGYTPAVGDEIRVEYNRYGKPSGISLV